MWGEMVFYPKYKRELKNQNLFATATIQRGHEKKVS